MRLLVAITFDNMKRLGFRAANLSTDKNAGARTKAPQTIEPQLFYIVCCMLAVFCPPCVDKQALWQVLDCVLACAT